VITAALGGDSCVMSGQSAASAAMRAAPWPSMTFRRLSGPARSTWGMA